MEGFSIIVCTYNGTKKLHKLFNSLLNLKVSHFEYEILVVDNNSTDGTFELANILASSVHNLSIRVLKEEKQGKVYALRNGFDNARFEYLIICDDDNLLMDDYLLIAYDLLSKNQDIGIIGGKGIPHRDLILPDWFHLHENAWAIGEQISVPSKVYTTVPFVWGAGMVLRKSAWLHILKRGFVSFLTGRNSTGVLMAGEDTELCLLVRSIGFNIHFNKNLVFVHDIDQYRLNWNYLLQLKIGFARSQVYFNIYNEYFKKNLSSEKTFKSYLINQITILLTEFGSGATRLDYYKSIYIGFLKNKVNYNYGLEKRRQIYSLKELCYVLINYKRIYAVFSQFKCS